METESKVLTYAAAFTVVSGGILMLSIVPAVLGVRQTQKAQAFERCIAGICGFRYGYGFPEYIRRRRRVLYTGLFRRRNHEYDLSDRRRADCGNLYSGYGENQNFQKEKRL